MRHKVRCKRREKLNKLKIKLEGSGSGHEGEY